jgi:hypothetical protein
MFLRLFTILLLCSFLCISLDAQLLRDRDKKEKKEEGEKKEAEEKLTEKELKELVRVCFVVKGPDGKEWVVIRLTVEQHKRVSKKKLPHPVLFLLHPRQRLALRQAMGEELRATKLFILVSSRRMHKSDKLPSVVDKKDKKFELKEHYTLRPIGSFTKLRDKNLGLRKDKDGMEEKEEPEQPSSKNMKKFDGIFEKFFSEKEEKKEEKKEDKEDKEDKE